MSLPRGILSPTQEPHNDGIESEGEIEGQGGEAQTEEPTPSRPAKSTAKKKKTTQDKADRDGLKLYLTEDVRFRLRMLAFKKGGKLSTVANEVLDRALPKWKLDRVD